MKQSATVGANPERTVFGDTKRANIVLGNGQRIETGVIDKPYAVESNESTGCANP